MKATLPEAVQRILSQLNTAGFEAYAVGGCVRDLLRGVEPQDWDICTSALPQQTKAVFAGQRVLETGLRHGTVAVVLDGQVYEITTYRADGTYSDGRHPDSVAFVSQLHQDLARRDFTVNAMAMDLTGHVEDPFGGAGDVAARCIRCVGDARRRFQEDGLRVMRCLRFAATLGYSIDAQTAAAATQSAAMLDKVAAERICAELCKLLVGERAVDVLRDHPAVFFRFWPQLEAMARTPQTNPYHCYDVWEHTLHALAAAPAELTVRLAVLLHDVGKPSCRTVDDLGVDHFYGHPQAGAALADQMLRTLKFDNATRQRVVLLVEHHDTPILPTPKAVKRWLGKLGQEAFFQLLEVKRCDTAGHIPAIVPARLAQLEELAQLAGEILAQGQCFSLKDLAVNGADVLAAGIAPGPQVGQTLSALLDQVVSGQVPNDRSALLALLRRPET